MASADARAYIIGVYRSRRSHQRESRGRAPRWSIRGSP